MKNFVYIPDFYNFNKSDIQFLNQEKPKNKLYNNQLFNRYQKYYGYDYVYYDKNIRFREIPDTLRNIIEKVKEVEDYDYNSVIVNWYEDGQDNIDPHSDYDKYFQDNAPVVVVSYGETRTLLIKDNESGEERQYDIEGGSCYFMLDDFQKKYTHAILKSNTKKERVSITIRSFRF